MEPLVYQPLLLPTSIRLLEIRPGFLNSEIECRLLHVPFLHDDCPPFEALSYVWGSLIKSRTIICNGHHGFPVTQSLHSALCQLRMPCRSRLIWADAICIDQENIGERNHQVRIMKDIYAAAVRVCVWLGPDTSEDADRASILMATIAQTCNFNAQQRGRSWNDLTTQERFKYTDLPLLGKFGDVYNANATDSGGDPESVVLYWRALRTLFLRPWFTRVWCVQEITVARDSIVMYGDVDIPWHVIEMAATWLNSQQIYHDFKVPSLIEGIEAFNALMMCEASDPQLRSNTLIGALKAFQDFRATDPRDKIYAIMGIAEDHRLTSRIPIDYEESVADIYMRLVEAALETQRDLLVLACVQQSESFTPDPDFPSWCPRWDKSRADGATITSDIGVDEYDWRASAERKLDVFTIDQPSQTLSLMGVIFDSVNFVSNVMNYDDFDFSPQGTGPSTILSLWRKFIDPHTTSIAGISRISTFALALTCETDINDDHVMDLELAEDRDVFFTDFLAYIMHLHDREEEREKERDKKQDSLNGGVLDGETDTKRSSEEDTRPSSFPSEDGDWKRYETAASRTCDQRRFFMTSRAFMGLGPAPTQEGDLVVVLFGGRVPFMLRRANQPLDPSPQSCQLQSLSESEYEAESYHHLLGEAFVQDIMRGEIIEELAERKFVEEEFRIK